MRTPKDLSPLMSNVYCCELEQCPVCHEPLSRCNYRSGDKTIQALSGVYKIVYQPKCCVNPHCKEFRRSLRSAEWLQIAPLGGTYGYDVIAMIGWQRQEYHRTFGELYGDVRTKVAISASQVQYVYTQQYLPLLACHERQYVGQLQEVSERTGLLLSVDGLAPEGGEAQLWVVRELCTGLTLRSGWMSMQDQRAFENVLSPIATSGFKVSVVLSDKQRGVLPAIQTVFPDAKHALCQAHQLKNMAEPIATADEAMKVSLRKAVRASVGAVIRSEHVEDIGVLTVTGLVPSASEWEPSTPETGDVTSPQSPDAAQCPPSSVPQTPEQKTLPTVQGPESVAHQRDEIVTVLQQRIRYLLPLKGRPPFRLAGIEMYERLTEVNTCLQSMLAMQTDSRLTQLQQGLEQALSDVENTQHDLRQAANWLEKIATVLDPEGTPERTGDEVRGDLFDFLDTIRESTQDNPVLGDFAFHLHKTPQNYEPGLFHTYDIEDVPRTNNDREREFRDLMRHLFRTTGQKGATRRIIQRAGAWEAIPHPGSVEQTVEAISHVAPEEFRQERKRVCNHRKRFTTHTRSAKQSPKCLEQFVKQWGQLAQRDEHA